MFTILLAFLYLLNSPLQELSMQGVKIHDKADVLKSIHLPEVASGSMGKAKLTKYRTENGNDLSVTTLKGKVVFLENDWLHEQAGKQPLLGDFVFGETSLRDIRTRFGTNGFVYRNQGSAKTKTHLVMFNCFEMEAQEDVVLVLITSVALDADVNEDNVADQLKLEALMLSDSKYLEELWGSEKAYDPNYKKVSW